MQRTSLLLALPGAVKGNVTNPKSIRFIDPEVALLKNKNAFWHVDRDTSLISYPPNESVLRSVPV
ncbi:hypothetical protein AXFE_15220 [Acidithrix ferrooxidans]|uniref:Uncharacterized protein n=1 Tax=Acidithrix ferrooxidans TaxID=1280514 RepID=A0A0D8HIL4_9ACTN|nr:hypothetical protein AXFE_15220 [Acidithrix ferrooxidans]